MSVVIQKLDPSGCQRQSLTTRREPDKAELPPLEGVTFGVEARRISSSADKHSHRAELPDSRTCPLGCVTGVRGQRFGKPGGAQWAPRGVRAAWAGGQRLGGEPAIAAPCSGQAGAGCRLTDRCSYLTLFQGTSS